MDSIVLRVYFKVLNDKIIIDTKSFFFLEKLNVFFDLK